MNVSDFRFPGWLPIVLLAAVLLGGAAPAPAAEGESGLPLPRFVSIRADEVNLRIGPGIQYPVDWVYLRKSLPVEIVAEFQTWRKIRDWQGTQGWVHQSMLSGHRGIIVTGKLRTLRKKANVKGAVVARAEPGVVGKLLKCAAGSGWCRVEIDGFKGWLRRVEFWGAYTDELVE